MAEDRRLGAVEASATIDDPGVLDEIVG